MAPTVLELARRAQVERFSTHTRHLCLTDLARAVGDIHEIAASVGHRSIQTTLLYDHLGGPDLAATSTADVWTTSSSADPAWSLRKEMGAACSRSVIPG
jgi:integrase